MKQWITSGLAALALVFATSAVSAQQVAIVDVNLILNNMPEYEQAQKELDKIAAQWRQDIDEQYDEIKSMYNKYQAEQVLLSEEERKKRENQIMEKEQAVREQQKKYFGPEGKLFQKRQELVTPIQDKVYNAIEEYANDRGYDIMFDKSSSSGLIFSNERYEKTEDVMDKLGIEAKE